jgi:hypothetical protein
VTQLSDDLPRRIVLEQTRLAHARAAAVELGYTDTAGITEPQSVRSSIFLPVQYAEDRNLLADVVDNLFDFLTDYFGSHPGVRSSWYLPDGEGQRPAVLEIALSVSPRYTGVYAGAGPEVAQMSLSVELADSGAVSGPGAGSSDVGEGREPS